MPLWNPPLELTPDHYVLASLIAIGTAYLYAVVVWPLLRRRGPVNLLGKSLAVVPMSFAFLVSPVEIGARAAVMYGCTELTFKMIDYSRYCRLNDGGPLREYLRFLIPFPTLQVTFRRPRGDPVMSMNVRHEAFKLLSGTAGFLVAFATLQLSAHSSLVQTSFAVDHAITFVLFIIAIESLSRALSGLERLVGMNPSPLINQAYRSQTVAEFWCRYNTRVHTWLTDNVFRPAGGVGTPVRSVFAVFFVSAILHEVAFAIATSRLDGYQFAFFMIQAPAVFGTLWVQRATRKWGLLGRTICHLVTIGWLAVSSLLFFRGVDRVFPFFYVSNPWLP